MSGSGNQQNRKETKCLKNRNETYENSREYSGKSRKSSLRICGKYETIKRKTEEDWKMRRKAISASLAAAVAVMALAGCQSTDTKTTTAVQTTEAQTTEAQTTEAQTTEAEETTEAKTTAEQTQVGGELVLYTWEGMFPQEVLDGFEETYGIKIIYSNFDTDETMLQKLSTAKGGDYDLVIADDYIIESAISEGLAQKLDQTKISNWDNINPVYQSQFYDPDNEYTVPYGAGIPLIVYDPDVVDIEITGYNDLWDESLKDSVALTANYRVIMGITLLSMGESMNTEDVSVIEQAGEKLKELAPNVRMIQDDNTQLALLNGEASVAFLYTSQVYAALSENPNLKVCVPEEGLGYGVMAGFIPSEAPNPDAAHLFLNYILEPEVAASCFEYIGYYCTTQAAEDLISEEAKELLVAPSGATMEMVQNVSSEADEAFNKAWTEFKAACK
jgi:spermidine/putrescine transport system substrate-binding protein